MSLKDKFKKIQNNKKIYNILHYEVIFKEDIFIFRGLKFRRFLRHNLCGSKYYYNIYLLSSNVCIYDNKVLYENLGTGEKILSILNQLIENQTYEEIKHILHIRDWLKEQQL